MLNIVKDAVVVVFDFAELQEVLASVRRLVDVKIDRQGPQRRLDNHSHHSKSK